ncbi:MAG: GNAT family N-acetyltransferase [Actinomycetota bacterium]
MFITRATRHDKPDIKEFLDAHGWTDANLGEGATFFARDGKVVGSVRLVEVEPRQVVVDDLVVHEARRRQGIGTALMKAAMNSRGGTLHLCCHEENLAFYATLGFEAVAPESLPGAVLAYFEREGDHPTPEDHPQHHFLKAR